MPVNGDNNNLLYRLESNEEDKRCFAGILLISIYIPFDVLSIVTSMFLQ